MITGENKKKVLIESQEKNYPINQFMSVLEGIYYTENV
jgi:hypothetical protein